MEGISKKEDTRRQPRREREAEARKEYRERQGKQIQGTAGTFVSTSAPL